MKKIVSLKLHILLKPKWFFSVFLFHQEKTNKKIRFNSKQTDFVDLNWKIDYSLSSVHTLWVVLRSETDSSSSSVWWHLLLLIISMVTFSSYIFVKHQAYLCHKIINNNYKQKEQEKQPWYLTTEKKMAKKFWVHRMSHSKEPAEISPDVTGITPGIALSLSYTAHTRAQTHIPYNTIKQTATLIHFMAQVKLSINGIYQMSLPLACKTSESFDDICNQASGLPALSDLGQAGESQHWASRGITVLSCLVLLPLKSMTELPLTSVIQNDALSAQTVTSAPESSPSEVRV